MNVQISSFIFTPIRVSINYIMYWIPHYLQFVCHIPNFFYGSPCLLVLFLLELFLLAFRGEAYALSIRLLIILYKSSNFYWRYIHIYATFTRRQTDPRVITLKSAENVRLVNQNGTDVKIHNTKILHFPSIMIPTADISTIFRRESLR